MVPVLKLESNILKPDDAHKLTSHKRPIYCWRQIFFLLSDVFIPNICFQIFLIQKMLC